MKLKRSIRTHFFGIEQADGDSFGKPNRRRARLNHAGGTRKIDYAKGAIDMFCLRQKVRISFNPVSKTQEVIAQIPVLMIPLQYHLKSALF